MTPAIVLLAIVILAIFLILWCARHAVITLASHRLEIRKLEIHAHLELHLKRLELEYELTQQRMLMK